VGVSNFFLGGGTSFLYLHAIRSRSGGGPVPPPHVKFPAWGGTSPPPTPTCDRDSFNERSTETKTKNNSGYFASNPSHFGPHFHFRMLQQILAPKLQLLQVNSRQSEGGRLQFAAAYERLHALNGAFDEFIAITNAIRFQADGRHVAEETGYFLARLQISLPQDHRTNLKTVKCLMFILKQPLQYDTMFCRKQLIHMRYPHGQVCRLLTFSNIPNNIR